MCVRYLQAADIAVSGLSSLGLYELSTTPELRGDYMLHVLLHGAAVSESPVRFAVVPFDDADVTDTAPGGQGTQTGGTTESSSCSPASQSVQYAEP